MALDFTEFFGYAPLDPHREAAAARNREQCPFVGGICIKHFGDSTISGSCVLKPTQSEPVICCPNRMYGNDYLVLQNVAESAFGTGVRLVSATDLTEKAFDGRTVAVFGKRWGKELRLPSRGARGSYFVDWVLALIGADGELSEFVAAEVQTIDTTGNYRKAFEAYRRGQQFDGKGSGGMNWENVSKRILPQLIFKGHVLRREPLCQKGLYFICPKPVYERIRVRLGNCLGSYPLQPGALTFHWYNIGPEVPSGCLRTLELCGCFTTTVDQVANALAAPTDLPDAMVYETAIRNELARSRPDVGDDR